MDVVAPLLTKDRYIDLVRSNSSLLAAAARRDLTAPVPTCPGWAVATLVAHLGEVQRFWTLHITIRAQEQQTLPDSAFESCPGLPAWLEGMERGEPDLNAIPEGLVDWLEIGTRDLVAAFEAVGPGEAIWHWSGDNRAITHMRNQAIEAAVHRWDVENALGQPSPIQHDLVLDGIEQYFDVQIPAAQSFAEPARGSGETYHFHRTDGPGEWWVRFAGDEVTVRREHARGDVALRGTAEDLFLWLWGRIPADRLDVFGDPALLERYRQLMPW